jgi:hypothetical protein
MGLANAGVQPSPSKCRNFPLASLIHTSVALVPVMLAIPVVPGVDSRVHTEPSKCSRCPNLSPAYASSLASVQAAVAASAGRLGSWASDVPNTWPE